MGRDRCEVDFFVCTFYIILILNSLNVLPTWKKIECYLKQEGFSLQMRQFFSFHTLQHDFSAAFSLWQESWWIITLNLKITPSLHTHTLTLYPHQSRLLPTMSPLNRWGPSPPSLWRQLCLLLHQICVQFAASWIQSIKSHHSHICPWYDKKKKRKLQCSQNTLTMT